MRIYYDELTKNIVLGTASRLFATGSLVAMQDRGRVSIVYKETNFPEAFIKFNEIQKQDGTSAGATIQAVIIYLNGEFDKTPFSEIVGGASYPPTELDDNATFIVPAKQQVLYSYAIDLGVNAMIEFNEKSVMIEVN